MNRNLWGRIYGGSSIPIAHFFLGSAKKTWLPKAILVSGWSISKNLLWNCLTKWAKVWYEISMEDPLYRFPILSQYVDKHGRHRQFLFLVDQILKIFSSETIGQIKQHFIESIYGGPLWDYPISSRLDKACLLWAILVSDCPKFKKSWNYVWNIKKKVIFSETRRHNELLLCRNDVWENRCKITIFGADHTTNMAAIGSSCW